MRSDNNGTLFFSLAVLFCAIFAVTFASMGCVELIRTTMTRQNCFCVENEIGNELKVF